MGTENFAEALRGCEKELAIFGLNRRLLIVGTGPAYRVSITAIPFSQDTKDRVGGARGEESDAEAQRFAVKPSWNFSGHNPPGSVF